jgi:AAA family ATP:ADP antiporter
MGSFFRIKTQIEPGERPAVVAAFLSMFCVLTAYMVLRPVRDSMGISAGISTLPLLAWITLAAVLCCQPLFGWLAARLKRTTLVPAVYLFFAANLVAFYGLLATRQDAAWLARSLYVWMAVTNLIAVSLFWSVMVDVFRPRQATRLFGIVSAGASTGGIVGPLITRTFVLDLGRDAMLLIAAAFLVMAVIGMRYLAQWHARDASIATPGETDANQALGGSAWAGLSLLVTRPSLLAIALFMLLLGWSGQILYYQQMSLVAATVHGPGEQTQLFAGIDLTVQILSLLTQVLAFNWLLERYGFRTMILLVPVLLAVGFVGIAASPALTVVLGVMIMRRVGEYSVTRPARELIFTTFDRETKYKAKNTMDSFMFRFGDATGASIYALLAFVGLTANGIAVAGVLLAVLWGLSGFPLARIYERANAERRGESGSPPTRG